MPELHVGVLTFPLLKGAPLLNCEGGDFSYAPAFSALLNVALASCPESRRVMPASSSYRRRTSFPNLRRKPEVSATL